MSYLNDHKLLEELVKIRRGYDRMRMWVAVMIVGVIACFFLLWSTTTRVRWFERKWDQGNVILIIDEEDIKDAREMEKRRRRTTTGGRGGR